MADNIVSRLFPGDDEDKFAAITQGLNDIKAVLGYDPVGTGKAVPKEPTDIARYFIGQGFKARTESKKALKDVFQSLINDITRGQLNPEQARYSYLDLVRSTGGNLSKGLRKSEQLANTPMGFASAESYNRYKPAASLAYEQLLGRNISDPEYQNLVSAAQGLGISKGPDFQAFVGETLLSSPEYKSQAVVFNPKKVSDAINTFKSGTSLEDYAAMLGSVGR